MVMAPIDTIRSYDDWVDDYGFDLWGEWGEDHEIYFNDPRLTQALEQGRIVTLVYYEADCSDSCSEDGHARDCEYVYGDNDFVMEGWARVDVMRHVLLPEDWRDARLCQCDPTTEPHERHAWRV